MTVVGSCEGIDEGEIDSFSDVTEKVIRRDELVKGKLVIKFWSKPSSAHHGLFPPFPGANSPYQSYHVSHSRSSSATVPAKVEQLGLEN